MGKKTGVDQKPKGLTTIHPFHSTKSNTEMTTMPIKPNVEGDISNTIALD